MAQFEQPPVSDAVPPPPAPAPGPPPVAAAPPGVGVPGIGVTVGTAPVEGTPPGSVGSGRISTRRAFGEIGAVYAASFGLGIVSAIVLLRDPNFDSSGNIIDDLQSASLEIFSYVMQAAVVIFGVGYFSLRRGITLSSLFGRVKRPAAYQAGPYGGGAYFAPQLAPSLTPAPASPLAPQPVAAWGAGFQGSTPSYAQASFGQPGYPQQGYPMPGYAQMGYGMAPPAERSPGWQFARVFFLAMGGFVAFLIVAVAYAAITNQSTGAPSQGSSLWLIPVGFFVSAAAGFGEEMLITGMVVTTLEQAGFAKRAWVIYLVAICLRIPFHLYYGWAAVGVICFTVVNIWIYRRWRLLWPIVLAHAAYDLIQSLSQTIPGNAAGLPIVGLGLVTIVMVIVIACIEGSDASARRRYKAFIAHRTGMAGQPGPYGQPAQFGQPGQLGQPGPFGQPGQFVQPSWPDQPGQPAQPDQFGQPPAQPPVPQSPVAGSPLAPPPVPPTPPQAQPLMQFPDTMAQQPALMQFPETPQQPSLLQLTETPPVPPVPQASELQPPQPPQFPNF